MEHLPVIVRWRPLAWLVVTTHAAAAGVAAWAYEDVALALVAGIGLLLLLGMARLRIVVSEDGLHVRRLSGTFDVSWKELNGIRLSLARRPAKGDVDAAGRRLHRVTHVYLNSPYGRLHVHHALLGFDALLAELHTHGVLDRIARPGPVERGLERAESTVESVFGAGALVFVGVLGGFALAGRSTFAPTNSFLLDGLLATALLIAAAAGVRLLVLQLAARVRRRRPRRARVGEGTMSATLFLGSTLALASSVPALLGGETDGWPLAALGAAGVALVLMSWVRDA